jgi:hypothetical protein
MKVIIALLLATTFSYANETSPHLLKRIVTGGNNNATIGQVVASYSNGFHVGIRTPNKSTLSTVENTERTLDASVYPNPTDGLLFFTAKSSVGIKSVSVTDLYGRHFNESVDMTNNTVRLPYRGVFMIKVVGNDNSIYSTNIIFN